MKRIAIIGAGISGLVLAQKLSQRMDVVVFEKARGVGGRMSTRYADPFYFDHGAPFFTAEKPGFQNFLKPYVESGVVSEWKGHTVTLEIGKKAPNPLWREPHLVGSPHMNSLCKALGKGLDIRTSCEVRRLNKTMAHTWELFDKEGEELGLFNWVISTAPPAQTVRLFSPHMRNSHPLHSTSMRGCYALMLGFNRPWAEEWIAARVQNSPIQWISVNSTKPQRDPRVTCLVVHSTHDWAEKHGEDDISEVQVFLMEQFSRVTGIPAQAADYSAAHRWRYAIVNDFQRVDAYFDPNLQLAATSDWCGRSRVEDVWFYAKALAERVGNNKYR